VLRALISEGRNMLTVTEFVREIAERVSCSRRTAYRAIRRACNDGTIRLPGY
jgi:predicted transcriptional regulator